MGALPRYRICVPNHAVQQKLPLFRQLLRTVPVSPAVTPLPPSGLDRVRGAAICPDNCGLACGANHQFITMLNVYRDTGGIARVEEVVELFQQRGGPNVQVLADWIERREVMCFEWRADIWLPWFQFNRVELIPHPQLVPVFAQLNPVYDAWEMANWFARPNEWLADRIPVKTLVCDLAGVLRAAQVDRFIANG